MRIKGELANDNIETQTLFVSYQTIDDDGWRWSSFRALPAARFFSVPGMHGVDGGWWWLMVGVVGWRSLGWAWIIGSDGRGWEKCWHCRSIF